MAEVRRAIGGVLLFAVLQGEELVPFKDVGGHGTVFHLQQVVKAFPVADRLAEVQLPKAPVGEDFHQVADLAVGQVECLRALVVKDTHGTPPLKLHLSLRPFLMERADIPGQLLQPLTLELILGLVDEETEGRQEDGYAKHQHPDAHDGPGGLCAGGVLVVADDVQAHAGEGVHTERAQTVGAGTDADEQNPGQHHDGPPDHGRFSLRQNIISFPMSLC